MSSRWSSEIKWKNFMTLIHWNGIKNWNTANQQMLAENIPLVQDWVFHNLRFLDSISDAKIKFKEFYFPTENTEQFGPHDYNLKTRAESAFAALYAKERDNERS